jgi:hypothetical protein
MLAVDMSDATAATAPRQHAWQLEDTGPDAYEREPEANPLPRFGYFG